MCCVCTCACLSAHCVFFLCVCVCGHIRMCVRVCGMWCMHSNGINNCSNDPDKNYPYLLTLASLAFQCPPSSHSSQVPQLPPLDLACQGVPCLQDHHPHPGVVNNTIHYTVFSQDHGYCVTSDIFPVYRYGKIQSFDWTIIAKCFLFSYVCRNVLAFHYNACDICNA